MTAEQELSALRKVLDPNLSHQNPAKLLAYAKGLRACYRLLVDAALNEDRDDNEIEVWARKGRKLLDE
jgi:hypothetical protein